MPLDDALADRQPEAGAAVAVACAPGGSSRRRASCWPAGMPMPLSRDGDQHDQVAVAVGRVTSMSGRTPGATYLTALPSRLSTSCRSSTASASTAGSRRPSITGAWQPLTRLASARPRATSSRPRSGRPGPGDSGRARWCRRAGRRSGRASARAARWMRSSACAAVVGVRRLRGRDLVGQRLGPALDDGERVEQVVGHDAGERRQLVALAPVGGDVVVDDDGRGRVGVGQRGGADLEQAPARGPWGCARRSPRRRRVRRPAPGSPASRCARTGVPSGCSRP